jgi:hypothetical protein
VPYDPEKDAEPNSEASHPNPSQDKAMDHSECIQARPTACYICIRVRASCTMHHARYDRLGDPLSTEFSRVIPVDVYEAIRQGITRYREDGSWIQLVRGWRYRVDADADLHLVELEGKGGYGGREMVLRFSDGRDKTGWFLTLFDGPESVLVSACHVWSVEVTKDGIDLRFRYTSARDVSTVDGFQVMGMKVLASDSSELSRAVDE